MSQTKDQPGWLKEVKAIYRDLTENRQVIFSVIIAYLLITGAASMVVGVFFGFSLRAYFAGIIVILSVLAIIALLLCCMEKCGTLDLVTIWQICLWTEVNFSKSRVRSAELRKWLEENCDGLWGQTLTDLMSIAFQESLMLFMLN